MTISLSDGRDELYQWDTARELTIDGVPDATMVHFATRAYGRTVDVEIKDGKAKIPDFLLQTPAPLSVYLFVGTADDGYTKIEKVYAINRRNKPADYVFTPTEQKTLEYAVKVSEAAESAANAAKTAADTAEAVAKSVRDDADAGKFKGEKGDTGAKGEKGDPGAQGVPGKDGENGLPGEKGDKGDKGDPGEKGEKGEKGDKGDKGDPGAPGEKGAQGIQGEKGDKGDTGAQGIQGEKGDKGDKGDTGAQGIQGEKGEKGDTGASGKSAYASAQDGGFTGTEAQFNKGLSVMGDVSGIDTTVMQNSGNLITSGAVYSYIQSLDANGVKY